MRPTGRQPTRFALNTGRSAHQAQSDSSPVSLARRAFLPLIASRPRALRAGSCPAEDTRGGILQPTDNHSKLTDSNDCTECYFFLLSPRPFTYRDSGSRRHGESMPIVQVGQALARHIGVQLLQCKHQRGVLHSLTHASRGLGVVEHDPRSTALLWPMPTLQDGHTGNSPHVPGAERAKGLGRGVCGKP